MLPGTTDMPLTRAATDAHPSPASVNQLADKYLDFYRERWQRPDSSTAEMLALPPRNRVSLVLGDGTAREELTEAIRRRVR
jgi:hypothetical protein